MKGPVKTILVVDDEPDAIELVEFNLRAAGYGVIAAEDGEEAIRKAREGLPDLIVLDVMLPEVDGMAACRTLKNDPITSDIPVIMLTAKAAEIDRVLGLELGADDYVTKPFSPKELILRAKAILKRNRVTPVSEDFSHGPFRFDKDNLAFFINNEPVSLSSIEFKLFLFLCQRPGQPQDRNYLLKIIWGYSDEIHSRTLDTHMKRLRQKLGKEGSFIETIRGIGYQVRQPT